MRIQPEKSVKTLMNLRESGLIKPNKGKNCWGWRMRRRLSLGEPKLGLPGRLPTGATALVSPRQIKIIIFDSFGVNEL